MPNNKSPARQSFQRWFVSEEFPILADDTPRAYKQHPHFDVRLGMNDLQTINKCSCSRTGRSKNIRCTPTKSDFFRRGEIGFFRREKKEEIIGRPKHQPGTRAEVRY